MFSFRPKRCPYFPVFVFECSFFLEASVNGALLSVIEPVVGASLYRSSFSSGLLRMS